MSKKVDSKNVDPKNSDPKIEIPRVLKTADGDKAINPLLARARIPGDTFRLPSCGIFYLNGELSDDVVDGEVHVYPMTTIDEIVIASPSKLFSGEGVIEVISRCVPSVRYPEELLAQDVDFILMCLRKVSYGPTFDFEHTHIDCKAEREEGTPPRKQTFQSNVAKILSQTQEIDPSSVAGTYRTELSNGQIIKMQPMRFKSYIKLMQIIASADDKTLDAQHQTDMMLDQLGDMLLSVDEVADADMIREWLAVVTPDTIREINKAINNMGKWGLNTKFKVKCRDCGDELEVEMPTNPLTLFS